MSSETGDNCIVLYPGTNAKYTPEDASKVLESFGSEDWIVMQNEISCGGEIMKLAAEKGKLLYTFLTERREILYLTHMIIFFFCMKKVFQSCLILHP